MDVHSGSHVRIGSLGRSLRYTALAAVAVIGVIASAPCGAASIPAWLDDGISKWNSENPEVPIRFVNVKDSYVWYDAPRTPEIGGQRIREGIGKIVLGNGYVPLDDETLVTTARPPVASGASSAKKCWTRSFVLNIQSQDNTRAAGDHNPQGQRQRMLTTLMCEDDKVWWTAFRVVN